MNKIKNNNWHNLSYKEVLGILDSDSTKGLSNKEAIARLEKTGENAFPRKKPLSSFGIFLNQFKSPLIYILLIVAIIVLLLEDYPNNVIQSSFVSMAIVINGFFGFWQENKTSSILEKLRTIIKSKSIVIRDGSRKQIFQNEIVPGDIILLKAGDKVPADARLIYSEDLKISEAILTGEWLSDLKIAEILPEDTSLADRDNMIYAGCLVQEGHGRAIIVNTGKNTEIGKIAVMVDKIKEEETPLQIKLKNFSKLIGISILIIVAFIFLGGIIRQRGVIEMFETSVAIAVGAIPEALPIVMTLILTIGTARLAKNKGLIRRLSSVEALGSTSVICCDKTKTLTLGKMKAEEFVSLRKSFKFDKKIENSVYNLGLNIVTLCNEVFVENPNVDFEKQRIIGGSTDKALFLAGREAGVEKEDLEKEYSLIQRLSFDSSLQYQSVLYEKEKEHSLYITGAPEKILELSKNVMLSSGQRKINSKDTKLLYEKLDNLTKNGRRVIGLGYREISFKEKDKNIKKLVKNITFVGFISLRDPLRSDVKESIGLAQKAGLKLIIITGDHRETAKSIAEELGLKINEKNIIEGKDLDKISDKELEDRVREIRVYARTNPGHKMRIVEAWQKNGEVVAMTGDGVNDAPALKKAEVGIALGSATDIAIQASDLILLNDSFSIIVKAIEQGRVVLDNTRKAIGYVLSDSLSSVILVGASLILGWPLPILWVHILWNNIIEDTFPNIAYAFEPKEKDVMKRGPDSIKVPLLTKEMKVLIFITGIIDQLLILILFWFLWSKLGLSLKYARTMVFGALCIDTAFVVYSYKNFRKNIWEIDIFNNKFLIVSSILVFVFFALAVYVPVLQTLLSTVPLGVGSWLILILVGIVSMFLVEVTKWYFIVRKETEL